jgi:hypothetical protein
MADSKIRHQLEQQPLRPSPTNPDPVDFGSNVTIFDPSDLNIQTQTQRALGTNTQFGPTRTAFFFKPGVYNNLTVQIGYYTTVHGLGALPDDVTISGGGVQSLGVGPNGLATDNFWRGVENLSILPLTPLVLPNYPLGNLWAVSQATFMRRIHVKGLLYLYDANFDGVGGNYSSGGFIADSVVDTSIRPGTQQQFLTRNTSVADFERGVWNMVFVGDLQAPSEGTWGMFGSQVPTNKPYTVIKTTPVIREKPYLTIGSDGSYSVQVPALAKGTQGPTWSGPQPAAATTIPINKFYIAKPAPNNADNAVNLNEKLQEGYHLILTPGIYPLASSLQVNLPSTVILGLGMATLTPIGNYPAMEIADVDGVSVTGILFDAGLNSPSLLIVGPQGSSGDHSANPTALFDLSCRVGGAAPKALASNCFTINSNNVIMDNVWIWRADHGFDKTWTGWDVNPSDNGLTVNGNDVTAYGLFVEHFKQYQTVWKGERGSTYFYQSEIPYDVPSQAAWKQQSGENGYPSYKVCDNVNTHTAKGLGVYSVFSAAANIQLENAISTPTGPGIDMYDMVTVWIAGQPPQIPTSINHILNGRGDKADDQTGPGNPSFLRN